MGRQISTVLTVDDCRGLLSLLRLQFGLRVLHARSCSPTPTVVESVVHDPSGGFWLYYYLVRMDDLDKVVMKSIPRLGIWAVEPMNSPVVEFFCSYCDGQLIRKGRIWYESNCFDASGKQVSKSDSFRRTSSEIFRFVKGHLCQHHGDFLGVEAQALVLSSRLTVVE